MNVGQRGQFLRKMIHNIREHEYPYDSRPRKKINWTSYDTAQVNEAADVLEMIRIVVDVAAERVEVRRRKRGRDVGRPAVPIADVVKVLMAQSVPPPGQVPYGRPPGY